jgi:hypothetical protein
VHSHFIHLRAYSLGTYQPARDARFRRFIIDIVQEEETDEFEDKGAHGPRLELYFARD